MSTKLYAGLKLKDPSTDIFELIPKIAEAIGASFTQAAEELVASELISWVDNPAKWAEESKRSYPIFDAERAWRKEQQDYGSHHTLNDPLRFSIVFGRSSAGNLLAYPYYSEDRYRKALKKLRIFDEYHYQNSSDRPRGISKKAWQQRSEEWDSLLSRDGTLGHLPMWEFGRSDEPFTEVFLRRGSKSFDPNSYSNADHRLKRILIRLLIPKSVETLQPSQDVLLRLISNGHRVVSRYLDTPEGANIARPAPVPTGIVFEYSDLTLYEADPTVLSELTDQLIRSLDS